jgi:hypothetical protein
MKFNSQDLEKITDLTLDYYNRHAEDFWEGTRNHDVSQNIAATKSRAADRTLASAPLAPTNCRPIGRPAAVYQH